VTRSQGSAKEACGSARSRRNTNVGTAATAKNAAVMTMVTGTARLASWPEDIR
jgi:hypothetical protein